MKKNFINLVLLFVLGISTQLFSQNSNTDLTKAPDEFKYKDQIFYKLPYTYNALEPYIDKETVMIHYDRHHKAYFTKYIDAFEGKPFAKIEEILNNISKYSDVVRNNTGGYYNHNLYWSIMKPGGSTTPKGKLANEIDKKFGSFENLKKQISDAALSKFGSGWAWLLINSNNELIISSTSNQDNPLMDVVAEKGYPILGLDVWEHAYYLKYQNKRKDYIENFWKLVNWDEVGKIYEQHIRK
jgi:Fe-Mn family superoxide dismutase